MKIVFMGTPEFAKESLSKIIEDGKHEVIGVVTNIDKKQGRGNKIKYSPVKELAIENNIPVYQPVKIRGNADFLGVMKDLAPDAIVVVAYGKILPKELLDIPKYGCINVHASLLPKYRGPAPIQWAIINGDKLTGVNTMYINEKMDEGDILLTAEYLIPDDMTTGELFSELAKIGSELLVETLDGIEKGTIERKKQVGEPSYTKMITKEMGHISWNNKARDIVNLVRGLYPSPGAYIMIDDKRIKICKVKVLGEEEYKIHEKEFENMNIGDKCIKNGRLFFKVLDGAVEILALQPQGKKVMKCKDYLNGNREMFKNK